MPFSFFLKRPLFYSAAVLSFSLLLWDASGIAHKPPAPLPAETCVVGGIVDSAVEERGLWPGNKNYSFIVRAQRLWDAETRQELSIHERVKVYLYRDKLDVRYGDDIVLKGRLAHPRPATNPNGFDPRRYWERQGIQTFLYADKTDVKVLSRGHGSFILARALDARQALSDSLHRHFTGDTAAFLAALFFGERTDLSEEFKDLFMKTGTLHILAVSGFNIGFLCAVILFFLKPFHLPRDPKLYILLVSIWAYCLLEIGRAHV